MTFSRTTIRTVTTLLLIVSITGGTFLAAPRPARAWGTVFDPANYTKNVINTMTNIGTKYLDAQLTTKEYALDPIAWAVAKAALQSITKDVVTTVNTGRTNPTTGGSEPLFVTNLMSYLQNEVSDPVEKNVVSQISSGGSPFAQQIAAQLNNNYLLDTGSTGFWATHSCTLSQTVPAQDTQAFLSGDFSKGGMNGFMSMVTNPMNNPYGTYYTAQNTLNTQIAAHESQANTNYMANGGMLSKQVCDSTGTNCTVTTPGSVILAQLNKSLGSGIDSLVSADEISEVISSLATNLVNQAIGGGTNGGLINLSQPSSGGGSSYLSRLTKQNPSGSTSSSTVTQIVNQVDSMEQQLSTYMQEWSSIYFKAIDARNALTALVNYVPSGCNSNDCATCSNRLSADQTAAKTDLAQVQQAITQADTATSTADTAFNSLETVRSQANQAQTSGTLTDMQTAGNSLQTFIGSNAMPTAQQIVNAQTQSTPNGLGAPASATSPDGLTVSGGTLMDEMTLFAQNAASALSSIQACFNNGSGISI